MVWNGSKVNSNLGLNFPHDEVIEGVMGLAYRNNKKRAHLLVSKVIGRYIPTDPDTIMHVSNLLSSGIYDCLNTPDKLNKDYCILNKDYCIANDSIMREELLNILNNKNPKSMRILPESPNITVFAYAEAATGLGAIIADQLGAKYLHSTRYPNCDGLDKYGEFSEEHSHASAHEVHVNDNNILNNAETIVLVDDELTTGKTIMNTIRMMDKIHHHKNYIIGTLTDLRSSEDKRKMEKFAKELEINMSMISLVSLEVNIPKNSIDIAAPFIEEMNSALRDHEELPIMNRFPSPVTLHSFSLESKKISHGINSADFHDLHNYSHHIVESITNSIKKKDVVKNAKSLVIGLEEDVFLPMLVSEKLQHYGMINEFISGTISPVIPWNEDDYSVRNRIVYSRAGDHLSRYVYNMHGDYENIIVIFPNTQEVLNTVHLLQELQHCGKMLHVVILKK